MKETGDYKLDLINKLGARVSILEDQLAQLLELLIQKNEKDHEIMRELQDKFR